MSHPNLSLKQEFFCTAYIETGNASEAYRQAYSTKNMKNSVINVKACELLKNGKITVRIQELMKGHAERHEITVDFLTDEYLGALSEAKEQKNPMARSNITTALGKLHGLIIEKQRVENIPLDTHYTLELVSPPNYENKDWAEVSGSNGNGNGLKKIEE